MRLFDVIRKHGIVNMDPDGNVDTLAGIPITPVIIDNVVEYMYSAERGWGFPDFFNVAPPWPTYFTEWDRPAYPSEFVNAATPRSMGTLLGYAEDANGIGSCDRDERRCGADAVRRWSVRVFTFARFDRSHLTLPNIPQIPTKFLRHAFLMAMGRFSVHADGSPCLGADALEYGLVGDREANEDDFASFRLYLFPALLATTFAHCKNVSFGQSWGIPRMPKHSKSFERKYGIPATKYVTLQIEPFKKTVRRETGSESLTPKSLHICRGHFKTYRDKGLFGKYKGTFWVPQHKRGDPAVGEVKKTYKVEP